MLLQVTFPVFFCITSSATYDMVTSTYLSLANNHWLIIHQQTPNVSCQRQPAKRKPKHTVSQLCPMDSSQQETISCPPFRRTSLLNFTHCLLLVTSHLETFTCHLTFEKQLTCPPNQQCPARPQCPAPANSRTTEETSTIDSFKCQSLAMLIWQQWKRTENYVTDKNRRCIMTSS